MELKPSGRSAPRSGWKRSAGISHAPEPKGSPQERRGQLGSRRGDHTDPGF